MHQLIRIPLLLLAISLMACVAGAAIVGAGLDSVTADDSGEPVLADVTGSCTVGESFVLSGMLTQASAGRPAVGARVVLQEMTPAGWAGAAGAVTDRYGRYSFTLVKSAPGDYRFRALSSGRVVGGWRIAVVSIVTPVPTPKTPGMVTTVATTPAPTTVRTAAPTPTRTVDPSLRPGTLPESIEYAQARTCYVAGAGAWGMAWNASDVRVIRQHLDRARTEFSCCRDLAWQARDTAIAADVALLRSVSAAYVGLANGSIGMYDGADLFETGRTLMAGGTYGSAATWFQAAADRLATAQADFTGATATLKSVSYAGTEFGDGAAYTAIIVPLLNGKAAYMGEYAAYARGWQHTATAYQAQETGDQATFRSEAEEAMTCFGGLLASPGFGADAAANRNVLSGLLA